MKKILMVEDDFDTQILFGECLRGESYEVITVPHGKDALEEIRQSGLPNLIVMDLTLPFMTPEEFLANVRAMPGGANIQVLIISGKADIEEICQELKAQAWLKKPFDLDPFIHKVNQMVSAS